MEAVTEVFDKNLNIKRPFDPTLLEHIKQRVLPKELTDLIDADPSPDEVKCALRKAAKGKAAGDSAIPVEYYQALIDDDEAFDIVLDVILRSWRGKNFTEWTISKLKILPKKGDLSEPNNWRPIMLLEDIQNTHAIR